MEEISGPRRHYGRLPLLLFDTPDKPKFKLREDEPKNSTHMGNGTLQHPFPSNHMFGVTRKVSLISLKSVIGSALSLPPSRKSSLKSINSSKVSNGSTKSQIRKNSGQFDGCNPRSRKQSGTTTRKKSNSSQSRKLSANSQRDKIISEIYQELEQLKEFEFSSSSEDEEEDGNNNKVNNTEDLERRKRVESYINEHSDIYRQQNFHLDDTESTVQDDNSEKNNNNNNNNNNNSNSSDNNDKDYISFTVNVEQADVVRRTPKTIKTKTSTKRYSTMLKDVDDGHYSRHSHMTSNRLTRLFLDSPNEVNVNDSFHVMPRVNELKSDVTPPPSRHSGIKPAYHNYLQSPDLRDEDMFNERRKIPRGSLYSMTSSHSTNSTSDPVPMNFIPGQTKPIVTRQQRSNSLALNYIRKARFCFKGVMVQIDNRTPRTFKAMAHAGMLSLSITGPSDHRCSH